MRPVVERTYPLEDAPEAIRYVESEHARTKVVVTTEPTEIVKDQAP